MNRILIVDDEEHVREGLSTFLGLNGFQTCTASCLDEARAQLLQGGTILMLLDLCLGKEDGLELLPPGREHDPEFPVIIVSGQTDMQKTIQAIRSGAWDYLEKPVDTNRLLLLVRNALEARNQVLARRRAEKSWEDELFCPGTSACFRKTLELTRKAGASGMNILLQGPNGTGKEILAKLAHHASPRSDKDMVVVNCAALPRDLFESLLFGHLKGAFTGAHAGQEGYFARADGGSLFLDEIGELPLEIQPKLLRALEYGEIQALGSSTLRKVDVHIIAATNQDLENLARAGKFRLDLLHRLGQFPIQVPSLEDRWEDLPALCDWILARTPPFPGTDPGPSRQAGEQLTPGGLDYLCRRAWPGNIRELRNFLVRARTLHPFLPLDAPHLAETDNPGKVGNLPEAAPTTRPDSGVRAIQDLLGRDLPLGEARRIFETHYLTARLEASGWSIKAVSDQLSMHPNNLYRRLRELEISLPANKT